jgi:hypothetical protein
MVLEENCPTFYGLSMRTIVREYLDNLFIFSKSPIGTKRARNVLAYAPAIVNMC